MDDAFASPPPTCTVALLSFPAPFVMLVTINRESSMNSIPMKGHWEGQALWDWFDDEPALRVAILTGKGNKAFSSGADLLEVRSLTADHWPRKVPPNSFFGISQRVGKKPVIAAVNGYAFGGGFEMTLNCDIVIASPHASFSLPEVKRGIVAGAGGLPRLVRVFGMQLASDMVLTGRTVSPGELKHHGFLKISSTPESLLDEALDMAKHIAAQSPDAILVTRSALRQAWAADVDQSARMTSQLYEKALMEGENARIGLKAFSEKRVPKWVASKL